MDESRLRATFDTELAEDAERLWDALYIAPATLCVDCGTPVPPGAEADDYDSFIGTGCETYFAGNDPICYAIWPMYDKDA